MLTEITYRRSQELSSAWKVWYISSVINELETSRGKSAAVIDLYVYLTHRVLRSALQTRSAIPAALRSAVYQLRASTAGSPQIGTARVLWLDYALTRNQTRALAA
jgi:hypothetical protein